MKLIITGAGGTLGQAVVTAALRRCELPVVASTSEPHLAYVDRLSMQGAGESADRVKLSVVDRFSLLQEGTLSAGDVVIHCAFPKNVTDPSDFAQGMRYHAQLVQAAAKARILKFVNVSSQSVYPRARVHPALETDSVECYDRYSAAKYGGELLTQIGLESGTWINARLASLIGRGLEKRLVTRLIFRAISGGALELDASESRFGLLDVRDAAELLITIALHSTGRDVATVNVGTGNAIDLVTLAQCVRDRVGYRKGSWVEITQTANSVPFTNSTLNCSLLEDVYGVSESRSLEDTIDWIIGAY
ncbi:MAG: NAD-dependent epimerase/dehydratase family protein [Yaniella sp.]|uniref:NAD-dependent epimerase/dehydratase family protein n=1 Tax=Yaniella sp. TaxID=2773929 RepID=UPI003F963CD7